MGKGPALSRTARARAGVASGGATLFYSTLTLRYDPGSSAFDDAPLAEFSKSREILSVREHFFVQGELPHLLLCISWRMPPAGAARTPTAKEDWKGLLSTPEMEEQFDRLRKWRNETAKQEGKPAYAILTNRMAAEVAVLALAAFIRSPGASDAELARQVGRQSGVTVGAAQIERLLEEHDIKRGGLAHRC